ncbi:MAG TPA: hypothetical protein VL860_09710 [Planctomycetota bacterium]|nr:hypothetical protein [Planctomycetota bacterium]
MSVIETGTHELPQLEERLKSTVRVRMFSWLCAGVALAAASLVAAFSVYSVIDLTWHLTPIGRTTAVVVTIVSALGMLVLGLSKAWSQSRDLKQEALSVQQANPVLGNALSASLLYGADAELTQRESSPAIVDRLVHSTATVAREAAFNRAVSWKVPKFYALLALALFLGALTAAQMNMRIFSLTFSRFLSPWADLPAPTWTALGAIGPYGTKENHWKVPAGAEVTVTAEVIEHDPGEAFIETRTENSDWLRRKMYRLPAPTGDVTPRYGYDFDNLLQNVQYRVICGDAQSDALAVPVMIDPQLADLEVTITPPAFLHRPPTVLRGIGDVDALKGSTVEIHARANKELKTGGLRFQFEGTGAGTGTAVAPVTSAATPAQLSGQIGAADYVRACEAAHAAAAQHPGEAVDVPIGGTDHDLVARFTVDKSGSYTLFLVDPDGKANTDELRYQIKSRANAPARVKITAPGKDVSVKNDATVAIDVEADDDFSLREIGLYMMIDRSIQRKSLQRLADGKTAVRTSYDLELAHRGFQGGEVITYWAFAVDEDGTPAGREVTSEPQFLMTYAENDFAQQNPQKQQTSQQSKKTVLGLDQLIDSEKDEVRDTFSLYMQMGLTLDRNSFAKAAGADGAATPAPAAGAPEQPATPVTPAAPAAEIKPEHASRATTLSDKQVKIQTDLKQLIADVRAELAKLQADQQANPPAGPDGGADPAGGGAAGGGGGAGDPNQLGAKELELLDQAVAKMDEVQPPLKTVRPDSAIKPENEALRLMSEARKLILSKNGQGGMKMAMDSANRKKQQRDQQQQDQQAQKTADEMRKLPPMLDDMDQVMDEAKKLEKRLDDQKKAAQAQPNQTQPPATPEEKKADEDRKLAHKKDDEENRKLAQKMRDQAKELADRAKESADRMRDMNKQDGANKDTQQNRDQAAEEMEKAARKLAKAGDKADQAKTPEDAAAAKQEMADAQEAVKQAADRLNQSLQAQNRDRLANAVKDAKDLEGRQNQVAQDTKNQAQTQQTQKANGQKPTPEQEKQNGQTQAGLAHEQKSLENDLGQMRERLNDLAQQMDQNAPPGSPQAQAAQELRNAAKNAETRSDVQRDMNNAAKELQNGGLEKAQEKQASAQQGLSGIRRQLESAEARNNGAAREELNKAINDLADLHRKINQARQNPAGAPPETTQPLAEQAGDLAKQIQDLAALDGQTRREAGEQMNKAQSALAQPAPAGENGKPEKDQHLGQAGQQVADATKDLQRALQNLDANQVAKAQALVDKTLEQQRAADQAMAKAADAKQQQAMREERNTTQAKLTTETEKQAARDAAAQADKAAAEAKTEQAQSAQGAKEIDQALQRLKTYLNGGKDADPAKPDPVHASATDANARQLAQTLADQFEQQKIPDTTRALAGKIEELADQQKEGAAAAAKPADPKNPNDPPRNAPAVQPDAAAKQWQENKGAGEKVETALADVRQRLDQLQAAVDRDELKRLEAAKQAVQAMQNKLEQGATLDPKPAADPKDPKGQAQPVTADDLKQMGKDLGQLKGDLARLNLDEKTLAALEKAGQEFHKSLEQGPAPQTGKPTTQPEGQPTKDSNPQTGSQPNYAATPASREGNEQLKFVRGGLEHAIERVLADRKINGEQEDQSPKKFDALVDRYFQTISDDQIEKKNNNK